MPVLSGMNNSFIFGGITFDDDDCVQSAGVNTTMATASYQCSGIMKNVTGPKSFVFNYTIVVAATNDSYVTALDIGSTSTLTYRPYGTTAGRLKYTSTRGIASSQNISAPASGVVTIDGSIVLDDLTIAANT